MAYLRATTITLLLLGLSWGTPNPAGAQQGTTTITGAVRDTEGNPVSGARISAVGEIERTAVTGPAGAFSLGRLPAGVYEITVESIGYQAVVRRVEARDATPPMEVILELAPVRLVPLQVLAATRAGAKAASLPIKVEVIEAQEVELQQTLVSNPTELLSNLLPSFSPARQKLTSAGESFRGRRPLFLVDGVPQSNPLRDGRRDGYTIDMEALERVEVVFGANAIQGLGATGGIVNYVTVTPPVGGRLEQRASFTTTSDDSFNGDGLGWRAHYLGAKRFGEVDVLGSLSYEHRGLQFDGEGRPIAIDNVQGDVADSRSHNFLTKLGWEPTPGQRLQLMVNDFRLAQDGDFDSVEGDRIAGQPAVSVPGSPEGVEPINDVTMISLDYEDSGFGGATLSAKAYYQDFAALFGGGRFAIFQDPEIAPVGELFDQSENNSEKIGARLTYSRAGVAQTPVDLIAGFDFLRDQTFQRLAQTGRNWVPTTEFLNYAPFVQLDVPALEWLSISGGFRWEIARLGVPDFTTLAGNREDFQTLQVAGGSPSFDEPLVNVGALLRPANGLRFYGTFSQAYTMPDVGRVLRGISEEGTAVDEFLALDPIKTDNLEFGGAWGTSAGQVQVTYFESESDFGSRLVPNADGIFQVRREPTRTNGWELTGRLDPHSSVSLTAGYSLLEGSYDGDGDGVLESDLGAADIGPDRLNLTLDLNRTGRVRGRLQSFTFFDEAFRDGAGEIMADFDGYTTVDASLVADVGPGRVTFSVANLLDQQYITYFGQAATDRNDRFFAGRGRTLSLRVDSRF